MAVPGGSCANRRDKTEVGSDRRSRRGGDSAIGDVRRPPYEGHMYTTGPVLTLNLKARASPGTQQWNVTSSAPPGPLKSKISEQQEREPKVSSSAKASKDIGEGCLRLRGKVRTFLARC